MDEFGETLSIYVWPLGHTEGEPYPQGFWDKVATTLREAGIDCERV